MAVSGWLLGLGPVLPLPPIAIPPVWSLPLFVVLGVAVGALGVVFNALLLGSVDLQGLRAGAGGWPCSVALAGMALGALIWFFPDLVGGGESLVEALIHHPMALLALVALLALRLLTTVGSYGLGLPGGIFAPLLALGTIVGAVVDALVRALDSGALPVDVLDPGLFAVAAMGALFAATVRAPLTGIVLAIELTGAEDLILPVILTCLSATFAAEALGGRPIYTLLLAQSGGAPPLPRPSGRKLAVAAGLVTALLLAAPLALLLQPERSPNPVTAAADLPAPPVDEIAPEPPQAQIADAEQPAQPAAGPSPEPAPPAAPESGHRPVSAETRPIERLDVLAQTTPPEPVAADLEPVLSSTQEAAAAEAPAVGTPGRRYALQVASFRRLDTVASAARRAGILERSRTLEPVRGWYPLLFGDYKGRAEAEAALDDLPEQLRRQGPIIRMLSPGTRTLPLR